MRRNAGAVLLGCLLALALVFAAEGFFRLNEAHGWLAKPRRSSPYGVGAPYDLSGIDLSYLQGLKPYAEPKFRDEPDYGAAYAFSDCKGPRLSLEPYAISAPGCRSHIVRRGKKTGRILSDVHYTFDSHGLRAVPGANPKARDFLLFLGCSFTYGEG